MTGTAFLKNNLPNANIYCTTIKASEEVMRAFDSDMCIEIFNPAGFVDAISEALVGHGKSNGVSVTGQCCYSGREVHYKRLSFNEKMPIGYWLKRPFYESQAEMRTVFSAISPNQIIEPLIINVPAIKAFIKRHNFGKP